ncbi:hypothetical protein ACFPOD_03725 [Nitratireductor kimnyeongensis]|uniref:PDZ domain-containing protein n=1 Tax=Nitratireductor kimnyeongensis TaxID=430679 RepID=A0ABW0T4D6_9HYPH|nr:hypothetical protein [Nitratireductor kimnyeongensis]QZZ34790.1 hypothetical protein KW403_13460 [Nitratireductor kimnyeongensis]
MAFSRETLKLLNRKRENSRFEQLFSKGVWISISLILSMLPIQSLAASKMLPRDKLIAAADAIGCPTQSTIGNKEDFEDSIIHRCILDKLRKHDKGRYKYMNPTDIVRQFHEGLVEAQSQAGVFSDYPYSRGRLKGGASTTKYLKAPICRHEETVRISYPTDMNERAGSPEKHVAQYAADIVIGIFRHACVTGFPKTINIVLASGDRDVVSIPYNVQTNYYMQRVLLDSDSVIAHAQSWAAAFMANIDGDGDTSPSASVADIPSEKFEYLCRKTDSPEALFDNVRKGMGLEFAGLKDPTITAIHSELDNRAGLQVGDRLVHVSGYEDLLIGKIYTTLCQHRQSALAMVERDGDHFEVLLSPGAATKLEAYATDFAVTNPFDPVDADKVFGSDGPILYNPVFALLFAGNFDKFDEQERASLIAILNVSLSLSPDMSASAMTRGKKALNGLRQIYGPSATACWPYGRTSFDVERFLITTRKDSYGAILSQAKSELGTKTLYFDPKLGSAIMNKWEVAMKDFGVIPQLRSLVDRQSCFSAEYRLLYNRLFELAGIR